MGWAKKKWLVVDSAIPARGRDGSAGTRAAKSGGEHGRAACVSVKFIILFSSILKKVVVAAPRRMSLHAVSGPVQGTLNQDN